MTKGKIAILGAAAAVLLLAGGVWAQAVGFKPATVLQTSVKFLAVLHGEEGVPTTSRP